MKFDQKKLNKIIAQKGAEIISKQARTISCPHCKANVTVQPGKSACPACGKEIDLSLNINTVH